MANTEKRVSDFDRGRIKTCLRLERIPGYVMESEDIQFLEDYRAALARENKNTPLDSNIVIEAFKGISSTDAAKNADKILEIAETRRASLDAKELRAQSAKKTEQPMDELEKSDELLAAESEGNIIIESEGETAKKTTTKKKTTKKSTKKTKK